MLGNRSGEAKKIICADLLSSPLYWWVEVGGAFTDYDYYSHCQVDKVWNEPQPRKGGTPVRDYFHFI